MKPRCDYQAGNVQIDDCFLPAQVTYQEDHAISYRDIGAEARLPVPSMIVPFLRMISKAL